METALRELFEETGLHADKADLADLGVIPYKPQKDLHLFALIVKKLPELETMRCTSFFEHPYSKKRLPEVDGYRYVIFGEKEHFMTKNMAKALDEAQARLPADPFAGD